MSVSPALVGPLRRAMWRTPVPGIAVLAAMPSLYAAARGQHDLSLPVTLGTVIGGASLAFALDDPAEPSLTPCPTSRATRRWVRAGLISVVVAAAWTLIAAGAHHADYSPAPLRARLVEAVAAAAISLAFAACAARGGSRMPGLGAVVGTLLTLAATHGLSLRFTWVPQLGNPGHSARWSAVAFVAAMLAFWWSRDPASRHRRGSHRGG